MKITLCKTCQDNENLEGYPDPDCKECKGTGRTIEVEQNVTL